MTELTLNTPITYLNGVGPHRSEILKKELKVFTLNDLLFYFPFRYNDRSIILKINEIDPTQAGVQFVARLINFSIQGNGRSKRLIANVKDDTGVVQLVWFQGIKWLEKSLDNGSVYLIYGKPSLFNNVISITHPEIEPFKRNLERKNLRFQPVYASTEKLKKVSLDSKGIGNLIKGAFQSIINIPETLPTRILAKYNLAGLKTALFDIHFPDNKELLEKALYRLKFEELFFLQFKILRGKVAHSHKSEGPRFTKVGDIFNEFYKNQLPFELTAAQKRVIKEIRRDTAYGAQMNRLLQGDVGSGKTVVALMSMLLAIDNGYQACLMAPTEILAQQHYNGLSTLIRDDYVRIGLLTGSTKRKERKEIHESLLNGNLNILIGTHALLEEEVKFENLGLAVIDEQHRFGVEQRSKLWRKNVIPPHMLVMTATPIPRTLAMTMYGDLDISVINELPAGRKPINTIHLYEKSRLRMFGLLREEISKGRQVYIVYPLIDESEKLDLLYLKAGMESLAREFPLPTYKIGIVHGKLSAKEKEDEMRRFVLGETQLLVATTVIEVGVNVPNASVMVIENAERFGLSQLHQLRGRVGRGGEQSFCILMTKDKLSRDSKIRIETMVRTSDGFEIAETDLKLRGPGDLSGTQQSGILDLKLSNLSTDQHLVQLTREEVINIFKEDSFLEHPENQILKKSFSARTDGIDWEKIS